MPVITRISDAAAINRIANHPAVLPYFDLGKRGALDFAPCVASDDYRVLMCGTDAAALFEWSAPGVWEGHTMFLPTCRGRRAVEAGKALCGWMFDHGADMLWGNTPSIHRHIGWFNRRIGFEPAGIGLHPVLGEVERFVMRKPGCCD
jgi:hypothetical protein